MGLPTPLGPHAVAFADFELKKTDEIPHGEMPANWNGSKQDTFADVGGLANAQAAPLMRVFYPTSQTKRDFASFFHCSSRWIPSLMYTWGYVTKVFPPSSGIHRLATWVLAGAFHSFMCTGVFIQASLGGPMLPVKGKDEEARLPVVVFSHGMWASRTTYTSFCCDLASHGYIVVAVEHLDGSANMACYTDHSGKIKWLQNSNSGMPDEKVNMDIRTKQLQQRAFEIQKVIDVLERLDQGLLTQSANMISGKEGLIVDMLKGRLNLQYVAMAGHSFGGATAVVTSGIDKRIKCCVAKDVWWEPIDKVEIEKLAGKVPVLLVNTQDFDWKELRDIRATFMKARAEAKEEGSPLVTELKTIKGTFHQDQSDFPLVFPKLMKKLGASGELDPLVTRAVNSKVCLEFLHKHLLPPGTGSPYNVNIGEDAKHFMIDDELTS